MREMIEIIQTTLSTIGVIMSCYIITKMVSFIFNGSETNIVKILAGFTIIIAMGGIVFLLHY